VKELNVLLRLVNNFLQSLHINNKKSLENFLGLFVFFRRRIRQLTKKSYSIGCCKTISTLRLIDLLQWGRF